MPSLPKFDNPAHVHFVTTNIHNHVPLFLADRFCQILLDNIKHYRAKHQFKLIGYVIMPDHAHLLLAQAEKLTISKAMQLIKYHTAKQVVEVLESHPTWKQLGVIASRAQIERARSAAVHRCLMNLKAPSLAMFRVNKPSKRATHEIWQDSFYDFNIYSDNKLLEKLNYIHNNPVRWELVDSPDQHRYSSHRNYFGDGEIAIEIDEL